MNKTELRREENAGFWRALPLAVLGWAVSLWLVGHFLMAPKTEEAPPQPVDARIVELPETPPPVAAPRPEVTPPKPAPAPVTPPPRLVEAPPVPQPAKAATPEPPQPPPPPPEVPPRPAAPMPAPVTANNGPVGVENHGASLSSREAPTLPDELMDAVVGMTVQAEFHVAADGSFTVRISAPPTMPTSALRMIQDRLRSLHAMPAVQGGKAVPQILTLQYEY